jgi:hypothetical protein
MTRNSYSSAPSRRAPVMVTGPALLERVAQPQIWTTLSAMDHPLSRLARPPVGYRRHGGGHLDAT